MKEFHIWVHRIRNLFYRTFFKKGACGGSFCTRMQNINKSIECYDHMLPKNCFCFFLLILCLNLENARWTLFVNHGKHPPFIITTVILMTKYLFQCSFFFAHLSLSHGKLSFFHFLLQNFFFSFNKTLQETYFGKRDPS